MKPIDLMHHKFGSGCGANKCGTCCNIRGYIYGNHSVRKCLAYGGLHSSKADWAKKWTACGLYGKKITRQMVSDTEKSMFFRGLKQKEAEGPMKGQLILEALKDGSTTS